MATVFPISYSVESLCFWLIVLLAPNSLQIRKDTCAILLPSNLREFLHEFSLNAELYLVVEPCLFMDDEGHYSTWNLATLLLNNPQINSVFHFLGPSQACRPNFRFILGFCRAEGQLLRSAGMRWNASQVVFFSHEILSGVKLSLLIHPHFFVIMKNSSTGQGVRNLISCKECH